MSGSWLAIAQGFAGMRTVEGISFAPFLPKCWKGYAFKFLYRGSLVRLSVNAHACVLSLEKGDGLAGVVHGKSFELSKQMPVVEFEL